MQPIGREFFNHATLFAALLFATAAASSNASTRDDVRNVPARSFVMPLQDEPASSGHSGKATADVQLSCDTNIGGIHAGRAYADPAPEALPASRILLSFRTAISVSIAAPTAGS